MELVNSIMKNSLDFQKMMYENANVSNNHRGVDLNAAS